MILAVDTSLGTAVALADADGARRAEAAAADPLGHAEVIGDLLVEALREAGDGEITHVVAGMGPGPFTGLRAGLVTGRTLGFAWALPVHGVCSLDAAAFHVAPEALAAGHAEFVVVTDARRKELYRRDYRVHEDELGPVITPLGDPRVGPPEDVPALPCYGSGAGLYPDRLSHAVPGFSDLHPSAADLARAAWAITSRGQELSTDTSPLYLRDSDAKVPASPKRATR